MVFKVYNNSTREEEKRPTLFRLRMYRKKEKKVSETK